MTSDYPYTGCPECSHCTCCGYKTYYCALHDKMTNDAHHTDCPDYEED